MSLNSSKKRAIALAVALPAWVFIGFMFAQVLIGGLLWVVQWLGVPLSDLNDTIYSTLVASLIYSASLAVIIGVPWLVKRRRTTKQELGLQRLPSWMDIAWVPAGAIVYIILSALLTAFAMAFLTFIDFNEVQDTGFGELVTRPEYLLAFLSLVVLAPVVEEIIFRGYLFGKLRKHAPVWVAVLITSLLFAIVHFQGNVGVDVFALGIVLCLLRVVSGSLWPSILLHMLKNGVAYYFLFINPSLLSTLGG
jgi:membrane protease YdiL (CAAX protease family)